MPHTPQMDSGNAGASPLFPSSVPLLYPFSLCCIRCHSGILHLMHYLLLRQLSSFIFVLQFSNCFPVLPTQDCFLSDHLMCFHPWVFFYALVLR